MFGNVYSGRKALITGHTGFKGSWLSAWLLSLGARAAGFSRDVPTKPANFEALGLGEKMLDLRGDIRDARAVCEALDLARPEIVFHLAAQALVRRSYEDPAETFQTNIMGTLNILEAARARPWIRAIVIITSDKCYLNKEWVWGYRENDRLGGHDPYSASKGCAELVAHSYFDSYFREGCACATTRAGNVIGGGDWALDRIVPDCARAWHEGRPVILRNPAATRPWQHVLEPLSGYLWLGARLLENGIGGSSPYDPRGQSYNFGPPADVLQSVAQVAEALGKSWPGFSFELAGEADCAKKECGLLKLCCDKALAELSWKATLDFEETIRYTAEWYSRYYARKDSMWDFSTGQIAAYHNSAMLRGLKWAQC